MISPQQFSQQRPYRAKKFGPPLILSLLILLTLANSAIVGAEKEQTSVCRSTPAVLAPPASIESFLRGAMGNRTRMIQVGLVAVAIGIMILLWGKSK